MSEKIRVAWRTGKRVYLSPITREDIPLITSWVNNPEINQFLTTTTPMSIESELEWFEKLKDRKDDIVFAIRFVENDHIIGVMGLHRIHYIHGTASTGSFIGLPENRGRGYGTEAKMLLLEYAFHTLDLHKVYAEVYDFNPASKRCMEKCGYHEEGSRKEQHFRNGRRVDTFMMAVFARDFEPLWQKYQAEFLSK